MRTTLRRTTYLGLLSFAIGMSGCNPPLGISEFNDTLSKFSLRMNQDGFDLRLALFPAKGHDLFVDKIDRRKLQEAVSSMATNLKDIQKKVPDLILPGNSSTAPAFKTAYEKYLLEEERIRGKAEEILKTVTGSLGDAEKKSKIEQLLTEIGEIEDAALAPLKAAQKKYCDEHRLEAKVGD